MPSLWCHNSKFTRCIKTLLNSYTWQFLKIYSILNFHWNHEEEFCQLFYFKKDKLCQNLAFRDFIFLFFSGTLIFLWCLPRFLKLLFSVFDSPSELLVLGNCGGNSKVFYLTLNWNNNNFLLYQQIILKLFKIIDSIVTCRNNIKGPGSYYKHNLIH